MVGRQRTYARKWLSVRPQKAKWIFERFGSARVGIAIEYAN